MLKIYLLNFIYAVSTSIGMTLVPLLATENIGMSLLMLGIIEGATEFFSNILRLITGNLFDRIKNRKALFVFPSVVILFSKTMLFFPSGIAIFMSKIMERIGNGAFAAPRDAFVGENSENKGKALGYMSAAKTLGCVLGPVLVSLMVYFFGDVKNHIMSFIFLTCLINFTAFFISCRIEGGKMKNTNDRSKTLLESFNFKEFVKVISDIKYIYLLVFIFFLARFNDGVILLYLKNKGFPEWFYLSTIGIFNFMMLLSSALVGKYADRFKNCLSPALFTFFFILMFNIVYVKLGEVTKITNFAWMLAVIGLMFWGLQRVSAQIVFASMIFNRIPKKYYGTAIGVYSILSGLGCLIASIIAGNLIDMKGYAIVFTYSGAVVILPTIILSVMYKLNKIKV